MSAVTDAMKPCPFCGGRNWHVGSNDVGSYWICCEDGCGTEGPYRQSEAEAVEAWNRRASLPESAAAHSDKLRHGLTNVAESLSSRPRELRGPFESSATALPESGEAVAWRRMNEQRTQSTGVTDTTFYRDLWKREGSIVEPLYASPVPDQGEVDRLRKAIASAADAFQSIIIDCQGASVCGEPEMGLEAIYHKASDAIANLSEEGR